MSRDLKSLNQLAPLIDQEAAVSTFQGTRERRQKRRRLAKIMVVATAATIAVVPLVQFISQPATETPVLTSDTAETTVPTSETSETRPASREEVDEPVAGDSDDIQSSSPNTSDQVIEEEPKPEPQIGFRGFEPIVQPIGESKVLIIDTENFGQNMVAAVLDEESGTLTLESPSSFEWRVNAAFAWTGDELLMVGGSNGPGIEHLAIAFNPTTDTWRSLPNPPGDFDAWDNRIVGPGVWTGETLVIHKAGLSLDPVTGIWETWNRHPSANSQDDVAVWTENELLVLESCGADIETFSRCSGPVDGPFRVMKMAENRWDSLPPPPVPAKATFSGELVGRELVVIAYFQQEETSQSSLLSFNIDENVWRAIDGLETTSAAILTSSTSNAGYFLVETGLGKIHLHEWRESALVAKTPVEGLRNLEGNSMALQDNRLIVLGPSLQEPVIVELRP